MSSTDLNSLKNTFYVIAIKFQPPNLNYVSQVYKDYVKAFNETNNSAITVFNDEVDKLTISQSDELEKSIYDDARSSQLIDLDNPMNEFYKDKGEFASLYILAANKKERRRSVIAEPMGGYRRTRRNRSNKRKNNSKRRKSQKRQKKITKKAKIKNQ